MSDQTTAEPSSSITRDAADVAWQAETRRATSDLPMANALRKRSSRNSWTYEGNYPRDRFGREADDNARLWLTYLDEAGLYDREKVQAWKEKTDILLLFAGLFSGIVTTLVTQSSLKLQQDYTQVSASLHFETNQLLRAYFSGLQISDVPSSTLTPTSLFAPSKNAFLVNCLWFISLGLSLATALAAAVVKQWFHYYMSATSGTALQRVRIRHIRFQELQRWKVGLIVEILLVLLYLAFVFFLTGVIIFLFPLESRIAWTILAITCITFSSYLLSVLLPIQYRRCPYLTSMTFYINNALLSLSRIFHRLSGGRLPEFTNRRQKNLKEDIAELPRLDLQAIRWLFDTSSDPSVRRIVTQGLSVHRNADLVKEFFDSSILKELQWDFIVSNIKDCEDFAHGFPKEGFRPSHPVSDTKEGQPDVLAYTGYQSYAQILRDAIDDDGLAAPLDVWRYMIARASRDDSDTLVARVIKSTSMRVFGWDATQVSTHEPGSVSFEVALANRKLNQWTFDFIFRCFCHGTIKPDYSSRVNSIKTRILLVTSIYRTFTSNTMAYLMIGNEHERGFVLGDLFRYFQDWIRFSHARFSQQQYLAFFEVILSVDEFWGERMTDYARTEAIQCLNGIWESCASDAEKVNRFLSIECRNVSHIYRWCSRDLSQEQLNITHPMLVLLFMPQNRVHLFNFLSDNPGDSIHLPKIFRSLRHLGYPGDAFVKKYIPPSLVMDLFSSVELSPHLNLLGTFYAPPVLIQALKFLVYLKWDERGFLVEVTAKLDYATLEALHRATMLEDIRSISLLELDREVLENFFADMKMEKAQSRENQNL